eukprot:867384_1
MPQIVLQSVFIIRSANVKDQQLVDANIELLLFSVLASLFSVSNKFVAYDKESVIEIAKSLKPRQSFPDCINYWYIIRALWRLFHVISKFAVFTLIWAVIGGVWLPIWLATIYIVWFMVFKWNPKRINNPGLNVGACGEILADALGYVIAILYPEKAFVSYFIYKWIEATIALIAITVFATMQFRCGICEDPGFRMLFGNKNNRIFIFWIIGIVAHVMDAVLYIILYFANILMPGRWEECGGYVGFETKREFKGFVTDYTKERITGMRMCAGVDNADLKSIQLQINGVWSDKMGCQEPINEQELILDDDEYFINFNKVEYYYLDHLKFCTNKGNVIEAGRMSEDEDTMQKFKLVDCKGRCDEKKIWKLYLMWQAESLITCAHFSEDYWLIRDFTAC